MAKQFDKSEFKTRVAEKEANDQLEDLAHLQEKKKRLGRSELFKREENESQSST
jgi:hypothetical protein